MVKQEKEKKDKHVREIESSVKIFKKGDSISIHVYGILTAIVGRYYEHKVDHENSEGVLTYIDELDKHQQYSFNLIESVKWA
ncbi:hypothetical protein [Leptospira kirschneri]|uniref:hypothetical protein n=1 Tax=Leptospira kirschneri TaxID=29507 RepID=UPI0004A36406|nr:hypothetical protein [Leptospira kirschneri]